MRCSVCIPTYQRPEALNRVLSSYLAMRNDRVREIIVCVTGDKESSFNVYTEHLVKALEIEGVTVKVIDGMSGLMHAKRTFVEVADSKILLLQDDDVIVTENYLDLLVDFLEENVAAVSGSMQTPLDIGHYKDWSDEVIEAPEVAMCNRIKFDSDGMLTVLDKYQVYMLDAARRYPCECLVGGALFIKRDLLEIDPWFERGASCFEEYDFTFRLFRKGYKLYFDSSAVAYHLHEETGGMRGNKGVDKSQQKKDNSVYFKEKWGL